MLTPKENFLETIRGSHYFCPCQTQGAAESTYEGVYETIDEEIDQVSKEIFGKSL